MLGGGHGALAVAGDLALRGFRVHLALRNRSRFGALFESGRLKLCGALQGEAELASISDDHTAVARRADVILVPLPGTAQEAMAERLEGVLRQGTLVALLPGNLGSVVVRRRLPGAVIAETATLPYGCRQRGEAAVAVALVAHHNPVGILPRSETDPALALLREFYPAVEPTEGVLSAALLNSNGALHAPLVLLNAGPIERLGAYDIHREGTTAGIRRVVEALDDERIGLRQALGLPAPHWPLADYYRDADWFYGPGAWSQVQRHSVWREKVSFEHRYLTEDLACGLALWSSLGGAVGFPTHLTDAFLAVGRALTGVDWRQAGRTLERLGLGLEELLRL